MPTNVDNVLKEDDKIPSNEEIVDELVKDLEKDCTTKETVEEDEKDPTESKPRSEDFIDEEDLKEKEKNYTEDDIKRLQSEAEEIKAKGNAHFKSGEYKEAAENYTLALRTCPYSISKDRAILYANRAAAKIKLELTESAIEDCTKAVELDPTYVRALLRRAQIYERSEKLDEALEDYKKILEIDPGNKDAISGSVRLPPMINERNEKLKTEMMAKLKDLGNMILKPFGLSTNNFQMTQDPNSGGYSVNFKQ